MWRWAKGTGNGKTRLLAWKLDVIYINLHGEFKKHRSAIFKLIRANLFNMNPIFKNNTDKIQSHLNKPIVLIIS